MKYKSLVLMAFLVSGFLPLAEAQDRIIFKFDDPQAAKPWQTVNDGVMGGRSIGRFKINADKKMEFLGTLSLENNGGFASVRARGVKLKLEKGNSIVVRLRGDGRDYNFDLYSQDKMFSYRQSFKTKKGEWIEVEMPVDKSVATWRGRQFSNEKIDPSKVNGIGIVLGDKKAGPFKLEVEWIKVRSQMKDLNSEGQKKSDQDSKRSLEEKATKPLR